MCSRGRPSVRLLLRTLVRLDEDPPNGLILPEPPPQSPGAQARSPSGVLRVRASTHEFRGSMIQPRQTLSPLPDPTCGYVTGLGQFPPSPASVSPVVAWGLPSARLMSSREAGRAWHTVSPQQGRAPSADRPCGVGPGALRRPQGLAAGAHRARPGGPTPTSRADSQGRGSVRALGGAGGGVHGRVLGPGL